MASEGKSSTVPSLVQVVPALPPRQEGIGGYALGVAVALRARGVETVFAHPGAASVDFRGIPLTEIPSGQPILLHYANYGYHPHGTPRALVQDLVGARRDGRIPRLVVFFHEFVATAPPWRRTFWTARTQRSLARHLAEAADAAVTTIPIYETLLNRLAPGLGLHRLAMPSPVGEPTEIPLSGARESMAVVFGGPGNRQSVYRALEGLSVDLARAGVRRLVDVGPGAPVAPAKVAGLEVDVRGELSASELSGLLLRAKLGFAAYAADFLGKSTAFAALAAHGVPCLALRGPQIGAVDAPCLRVGEPLDEDRLDGVSNAARAWYSDHRLATHVDSLVGLLRLDE